MSKLNIFVDEEDDVLTPCVEFIANVLGVEYFNQIKCSKYQKEILWKDAVLQNVDHLRLCQLPFILDTGDDNLQICYAGVCTVVRRMVHHVHNRDIKKKSISLLGYQETCLKAYAQVSQWTSFCENDFPDAVRTYYDDHLVQCTEKMKADIPNVLQRLEKELGTPKNLPNKSKFLGKERPKWLARLMNESFEGQRLQQSIQSYIFAFEEKINSSKSWSPYLNGFQITVADLIVLSLVAKLFQKLSSQNCLCKLPKCIPMVFEWIEMMKVLPCAYALIESKIKVHFNGIGHSAVDETKNVCTSWLNSQKDVDPVSQTKLEQRHKKIRIDHQKNIAVTLEKIEKCGIHASSFDLMNCARSIDWENHPDCINPYKGDLNAQRSIRKQQQISNILFAVKQLVKPGSRIVDFCAGGGHVGIVLAYFLKNCEVLLVENKEESILRAVNRIRELKLNNIKICHTNLDYFCGEFDIGVTLHACGVATDLVLNACHKERASFVVCPCCYGSIQNIESISYPRSKKFCDNLTTEEYMVLSHSSDMTTWDDKSLNCQLGRKSMTFIDLDRCSLMEELGYETSIRTMVPRSCSPKNHLLIGTWASTKSISL